MSQQTDKQRLIGLIEAPIGALGYEVVDIDLRTGRNGLLRVFIDREDGVTLDDCEKVSRQLSVFLDVEDPLAENYVLEVSSPGIERRLRTKAHFERVVGEDVKVQLLRPQDGRRRFRGRVIAVSDDTVGLNVDGQDWRLKIDDIGLATLVASI